MDDFGEICNLFERSLDAVHMKLTDADKKLEKLVLSVNATDATTKMSQFQN
jgi:hypothetical protein